jgi:hypothetical protein
VPVTKIFGDYPEQIISFFDFVFNAEKTLVLAIILDLHAK